MVDGRDEILTLGLLWYKQNAGFVLSMNSEMLKPGAKCNISFGLRFVVLGGRGFESQMEWRTV